MESPKPVIRDSLWLALYGCSIHFLPVATSITMIYLNLSHMYVGFMTGSIMSIAINTALLQMAAKFQELLIAASLSSIVMHHLRSQMLFGSGVPLGAVGSGFMISHLHYFWSPDFWGSLRARTNGGKQLRLYATLLISGLLTATVGPSSAILLIPRVQDWDAGSAKAYLPGSASDLWPSTLSELNVHPLCTSSRATNYAICPSGGFASLWNLGRTHFHLRNLGGSEWNISTNLLFSGANVSVSSSLEPVPSSQLWGNWRATALETAAQGPDLASAVMQRQILQDWKQVATALPYDALKTSISEYKYHYALTTSSSSPMPVVRVACSEAQNISRGVADVSFPVLPEYGCWNSSMQKQSLFSSMPTSRGLQAAWVPLSRDFGSASTGLAILGPSKSLSLSNLVVGCSLDARWANGTTTTPKAGPSYALVNTQTISSDFQCQYSAFRPSQQDPWTRVSFGEDWLRTLTPPAPLHFQPSPDQNMSTLEATLDSIGLFEDLGDQILTPTEVWNSAVPGGFNRTTSIEWLLANFMADGLSRGALTNVLNLTGPVTAWRPLHYDKSSDFANELLSGGQALIKPTDPAIAVKISVVINGFAFLANSVTDYLAISALLLHALLALIHSVELIWSRQHSSCWGTITELLALAQKSRPRSGALQNTGAGIKQIKTFSKLAKIRAVKPFHSSEVEEAELELLIQDDFEEKTLQEPADALCVAAPPASTASIGDTGDFCHRKTWPVVTDTVNNLVYPDLEEERYCQQLTGGKHLVEVDTVRPEFLYS